ncbi:MAG: RICIN domain-containing protein [Breznakibacter sp.]
MKKVFLTAIGFLICFLPWAQPTGGGWTLVFEDNFDGTSLDLSKWNYHYRWGRTHNHQGYSQEANVVVSDGTLKLVCTPTANNAALAWPKASQGGTMPANFNTGVINSKGNFTYGYYEIRVKMPLQKGVWPAFWMAADNGAWPPEIDIFEYPWLLSSSSAPTQGYMNVHWGAAWDNKTASGGWYGSNINSDFHTFAVNWTPTRIEYFVDGVCVTSKNTTTLVNSNLYFRDYYSQFKDLYMILNFGMGGDWPGIIWDNADYAETRTEVDYVRVWQRAHPVEGGNFIIQNVQDGKVMDVTNGSTSDGASVGTYDYKGSGNQFLNFEVLGDNYWKLTPLHSSKPLDVQNQSTGDGVPLVQNSWTGLDNQRWRLIRQYYGVHRIVNKKSNKVAGLETTGVVQQTWTGPSSQQWRTIYCDGAPTSNAIVADAEYLICVKSSTKPLEIGGGSTSNGAQASVRNFDNAGYQKWRLVSSGVSGYYKILNVATGKLLTVRGGSTANNAVVEQNADSSSDSQLWQLTALGNGYYRINNKASGKALDVTGGIADGSLAIQYSYWGGSNQQFCLTMVNRYGSAMKSTSLDSSMPVGQLDASAAGDLSVYPNPVSDRLNLKFNNNGSIVLVRIFDIGGRIVYEKLTTDAYLAVDKSRIGASGVYVLEVTLNEKQITGKISVH